MSQQQGTTFVFEENAAFGISAVTPFEEGRTFRFKANDPKIYFGDGTVVRRAGDFQQVSVQRHGNGQTVVCRLQDERFRLRLEWISEVREEDHTASWRLELTNEGEGEIAIRHIDLFDAMADSPARLFSQHVRLDLGEADWMEDKDVNHTLGYPVNIGDRLFLGIDWPVADVKAAGGRIVCRQYCADTLAPGQTFRSRTLTVGACEEGCVAQRFLAHLRRLRGRETRRASFYYSWLTHSWEGLTDRELTLGLDFFERLQSAYGIRFDLFAVDAGVVETNLYGFDRYRHMYERLLPHGLKAHANRVKELGMEFGIWIGPNEFGPQGTLTEHRIETIARMVREWNVSLIKLDTAVAPLLGDDPYENEHAMRGLERLVSACREINPNLIVINHRASYSPYILTILDSTLWEGRETYPDVHMVNHDKPRLFSRSAQHGFGEPTYFGVYSELLEDCGICVNGDTAGWADELAIQAFGRALMLSPEVYGALFLLDDAELQAFGRLMRLADRFRPTLAHAAYDAEAGIYAHADGSRAVLLLMNDSWDRVRKEVRIDDALGLPPDAERFAAILHYPWRSADEAELPRTSVSRGGTLLVDLHPFAAAIVELAPLTGDGLGNDGVLASAASALLDGGDGLLSTLPEERMDGSSVPLGRFGRAAVDAAAEGSAERAKFAIGSDPVEEQVLRRLSPSAYPEVTAVRQAFRDKLKKLHGIAANAWDGDERTAWGDAWHWKFHDNVWRIDLGAPHDIAKIDVTLSKLAPGPVFEEDEGRRLNDPILIEASADGIDWAACHAVVYRERQGFHRAYTAVIAGEFPRPANRARYIRMHMSGLLVQDIRLSERTGDGGLAEVDPALWQGNNLLTARKPASLHRKPFTISRESAEGEGAYLAVVCQLPEEVQAPHLQEVAVAWLTVDGREELPFVEASPCFPFHGWEWNTHHNVNAWVLRMPVKPEWAGKRLELSLAWYGPSFGGKLPAGGAVPEVTGYIVAAALPGASGKARPDAKTDAKSMEV